jgi:hypothetical protein
MEITAAIVDGRWHDAAHADVRAHARTCAACREVAEVALALAPADGDDEFALPAAGQVLWRARVRARADAARRAARPLLVAQALAAACALGLVAGLVSWLRPGALARFAQMLTPVAVTEFGLVAWTLVGASAIAASLVVYFVVVRE